MNFIQQTVVLVKPDGIKRKMVGEVISRFEKVGLKMMALKMVWVDSDFIGKHYPDSESYLKSVGDKTLENYLKYGFDPNESLGTNNPVEIGRLVRKWNMDMMGKGPLVAMLLEGIEAVILVRKMVGPTNLASALPGTIRGDFSSDSLMLANLERRPIKTLIHASGSVEEAEFEIKLWFKENEIHKYKMPDDEE